MVLNLQRLAGSEEVLPVPDVSQLLDSTVPKEIENIVQASLLKVGFVLIILTLILFQEPLFRGSMNCVKLS